MEQGQEVFRQPDLSKIDKKVICFRADKGACWYYRIHLPISYLTKFHDNYLASISSYMQSNQIGQYDIAIVQRQYRLDVLGSMLEMKQAQHKQSLYNKKVPDLKLVYEIDDDLFHVPKSNPAYETYGKKKARDTIKRFLDQVDAMFVTTEYLKTVYQNYCKKIYVLPNSIAFEAFYDPPKNSVKKVLLWQGSSTHGKDLEIIGPAIKRIIADGDVLVKSWGMSLDGAYNVPGVDFTSFYQMLAQMDSIVGLAPLIPNLFNKSKSNLKFLEYSSQGIATVASNFGPYADSIVDGESGVLIGDNRDWYGAIRELLDNNDYRNSLISNAKEYVKENFDLLKNYKMWKNAIEEIIGDK